jgi:hypothetical protein
MALRAKLNARPRLAPPEAEAQLPAPKAVAPSRVGKKQISFYVDRETKLQLDRIVLDEDRNLQALMLEACNLLFQSRGMARIAGGK